jgi:phosphoribosyl 1,2-cyclic phosphodiesterase
MRLHVIGSGSRGNAYVLTLDNRKSLLLDAGLPYKTLLKAIGSGWPKLCGCLLTHEHGDHAAAVKDLLARGLTVYASSGTRNALLTVGPSCAFGMAPVAQGSPFWAGATVTPFKTQHDAADPLGFVVSDPDTHERLVYATDTYYIKYRIPGVTHWVIECNYCDDLLDPSDPVDKRRLESHMSLSRLKTLLKANDLSICRKIVLIHLSDAKSDEARMVREITDVTGVETVAAHNGDEIKLTMAPFVGAERMAR